VRPGVWGEALGTGGLVAIGTLLLFTFFTVWAQQALSPGPETSLCLWDCDWYFSIARGGYQTAPDPATLFTNLGFFPGFPALLALVARLTGLPLNDAAALVNPVLSLAFCVLAVRYRATLGLASGAEAMLFLLAFLLSPWSLYNRVPYSEMLFNLAILGTFVCWKERRLVGAAAFGIVLTATRVSGVLLPLVLLAGLIYEERSRFLALLVEPDGRVRTLALMPLGMMAFLVYLYVLVGDPLAYFHAQSLSWNQGLRNPVRLFADALQSGPVAVYDVVPFAVATIGLAVGWRLRRIPGELAAFAWLLPALSLSSVPEGQPRYALGLFPLYLLVPALPKWLAWLVVTGLAIGQFVFVYFWLKRVPWLV
jgi:hypothetical protein